MLEFVAAVARAGETGQRDSRRRVLVQRQRIGCECAGAGVESIEALPIRVGDERADDSARVRVGKAAASGSKGCGNCAVTFTGGEAASRDWASAVRRNTAPAARIGIGRRRQPLAGIDEIGLREVDAYRRGCYA